MNTINKNAAGCAVGTVAALVHAVLAVGVWASPEVMQKFINFDIALHFMKIDVVVQPFSLGGAIALIIIAFCVGYILGRVVATIYNWKAKGRN